MKYILRLMNCQCGKKVRLKNCCLSNHPRGRRIHLRNSRKHPIRNPSDEQVSAAMAEVTALTLANICLDVQIGICLCLHPSDILALRHVRRHQKFSLHKPVNFFHIKTCKALQLSTRQRVVWVAALHRVCLDNTLFLPSFPISDMSDLELERSAMAPRRWIELCNAFKEKHLNEFGTLPLRPARNINLKALTATPKDYHASTKLFLVPGGRYLVTSSSEALSVLDLGCTSLKNAESAVCTLIASVRLKEIYGYRTCIVQATPDGMGLIIFLSHE